MHIDTKAAEQAIRAFLRALGQDPDQDPELLDTPARVVEAFARDLLSGYPVDVGALLAPGSAHAVESGAHSLVVLRDLVVSTVCPHHLMPATGLATVAYEPGPRLLGIGTIAALVDAYSRRLTLQETIGENVVGALMQHAGARGACCELRLLHSCMNARGKRRAEASVQTLATAGTLAAPEARASLVSMLRAPEPQA
jgi:GTP cyclohydrolase IA